MHDGGEPLVTLVARRVDPRKCPFAEAEVRLELREGACVHLRGPTGAGKSTLTGCLAGLTPRHRLRGLGISVRVRWREDVPPRERVGALFQSTTLLDSLSVRGNVAAALELSGRSCARALEPEVKRLVEAVGLDYARDGCKMPGELSGGMARRASLALQLAQAKRAIILDEPFTGLDRAAAAAVARELAHMRAEHGTALLLVSHQPDVVALVHDGAKDDVVDLTPAHADDAAAAAPGEHGGLRAHRFAHRLCAKAVDYSLYSLPLILLTFSAAGIAVASLLADLLLRVDVRAAVERVLEAEVTPLVKALLGADAPPLQLGMTMMMVKGKARALVDGALPGARAALYAHGVAKLFTLELGPLLTGLLLAGRIGGSYAGEVGTMEASAQSKLLSVLGASARRWTLLPASLAALLAAPLLSALGTALALALAALVGEWYALAPPGEAGAVAPEGAAGAAGAAAGSAALLGSAARALALDSWFWRRVRDALVPELRLKCAWALGAWGASDGAACSRAALSADAVELLSWPLAHHALKSASFIALTLACAELIARRDADLPPRAVPHVITASVVSAGVAIIVADWAWSRVLLAREGPLF